MVTNSAESADTAAVVSADDIVKVYWSYGKEHTPLDIGDDGVTISKYMYDLNVHVLTTPGNDGKTVKFTIEFGGKEFDIKGIVKNDSVVIDDVMNSVSQD